MYNPTPIFKAEFQAVLLCRNELKAGLSPRGSQFALVSADDKRYCAVLISCSLDSISLFPVSFLHCLWTREVGWVSGKVSSGRPARCSLLKVVIWKQACGLKRVAFIPGLSICILFTRMRSACGHACNVFLSKHSTV